MVFVRKSKSERFSNNLRFIPLIFVIIVGFLLLFPPIKADVVYGHINSIGAYTGIARHIYSGTGGTNEAYVRWRQVPEQSYYDTDITNLAYVETWNFNEEHPTAPYAWQNDLPPNEPYNVSITRVWIVLVYDSPRHEGNLSFTYNHPGTYNNNPFAYGQWFFSSQYPWSTLGYGFRQVDRWDVTTNHHWTIAQLRSENAFRTVYWYKANNSPAFHIDYIGVEYEYRYGYGIGGGETGDIWFGLVWLLIIFMPPILMNNYVPKYGFYGGIAIMLIIIGISQEGFLPVMLMGMITLAVAIYKEG